MKTHYWAVRAHPNGERRMGEFLRDNIIAVGWPMIGDLTGLSKIEIEDILTKELPEATKQSVSLQVNMLSRFGSEMQVGDVVFVPDDGVIYLGQIQSDYFYSTECVQQGYPHQRSIIWLKTDLAREQLPEELQQSMRGRMTLFSLEQHVEIIEKWLENVLPLANASLEDILYCLAHDYYHLEKGAQDFQVALRTTKSLLPANVLVQFQTTLEKATILAAAETEHNKPIIPGKKWTDDLAAMIRSDTLDSHLQKAQEKIQNEIKSNLQQAIRSGDLNALTQIISNYQYQESETSTLVDEVIKDLSKENKNNADLLEQASFNALTFFMKNSLTNEQLRVLKTVVSEMTVEDMGRSKQNA